MKYLILFSLVLSACAKDTKISEPIVSTGRTMPVNQEWSPADFTDICGEQVLTIAPDAWLSSDANETYLVEGTVYTGDMEINPVNGLSSPCQFTVKDGVPSIYHNPAAVRAVEK